MSKNGNYKGRAIMGVIWSGVERFSVQIIQFVVSVILARLLMPDDFGLIAIVLVFTVIFQTLNEAGLGTALIHKQDRDEIDFSTIYYTAILVGVVSYLIVFLISGPIANYYQQPTLKPVMRLAGLSLIANSFAIVPIAKFTISVDFKNMAKASLWAALLSGVIGIIYAYLYRNVYAIVVQSLLYAFLNSFFVTIKLRYLPQLQFSLSRFKILFSYAYKLVLARLVTVIYDDIYSLFIGKYFTPQVLGFYNRANSFTSVSSRNIIYIVQRVSIPVLCENQHSKEAMANTLLLYMKYTAIIVYPLTAGIMILGEPLIEVLLTEKWLGSAEILYYICPSCFLFLICTFNRNIYNATGRTDLALKAELIKKTFFLFVFFISLQFGFKGILMGQLINSFIELLFDTHYVNKQIDLTLIEQLRSLWLIIMSTCIMGIGIYGLIQFLQSSQLKLVLGTFVGVIIYAICCHLFKLLDIRKILL